MIQRTLGQVQPEIARICGDAGMSLVDSAVIDRINRAILELMNEGEFPGIVDRWHLVAVDGLLVLPTHLDRIMQLNVRGVPQAIASPWYQFVAYGPGTIEDQQGYNRWWCDAGMILDRGEFPVKTSIPDPLDLTGPWTLRIYTAVDEEVDSVIPYCTVQGLNEDGEIIRTQVDGAWINGERIELDAGEPYVSSVNSFQEITAFTKPSTNGYIRMTAWNGTVEVELSKYLPSDTTPSYHRYFSQWLNDLDAPDDSPLRVVQGRCRRRYVAATESTDVLLIGNVPALSEMVIAQYKRDADDMESFAQHKAVSVDLMKKEASGYRGKSRLPGLTFQRGFAIGSDLPALR